MKLCPVLLNSEDNKKYVLVAGQLLTPQEALERKIFFGYIDIAPLPEKRPITEICVLYEKNPFTPTGEMECVQTLETKPEEIPQELLDNALQSALSSASITGISLGIKETGGKDNE